MLNDGNRVFVTPLPDEPRRICTMQQRAAAHTGIRAGVWQPDFEDFIFDQTRNDLQGCAKCLPVVKDEFSAYFSFIKKLPLMDGRPDNPVIIMYQTHAVDEKRAGHFRHSSALYFYVCLCMGKITFEVCKGWMKTLAAAGDVMDAMALAEYAAGLSGISFSDYITSTVQLMQLGMDEQSARRLVEQELTRRGIRMDYFNWVQLNYHWISLKNALDQKDWKALRKIVIELGGGQDIRLEDIDVYQNAR